jgi:hypothetical protein
LIGPNGHPIQCLGEERQRLCFSGCTFERLFLRTDVSFPILGVDFLRANKLSVSVASNQLVDDTTGDMFSLIRQPSSHTASVMLPASMPGQRTKPASPEPAAPPQGEFRGSCKC